MTGGEAQGGESGDPWERRGCQRGAGGGGGSGNDAGRAESALRRREWR